MIKAFSLTERDIFNNEHGNHRQSSMSSELVADFASLIIEQDAVEKRGNLKKREDFWKLNAEMKWERKAEMKRFIEEHNKKERWTSEKR